MVGARREDQNGPVDLLILNGKVYTADGSKTFEPQELKNPWEPPCNARIA